MKMSLTYMDWIEKYNLNFQLHIKETEDSDIFDQLNSDNVTGNISKYNDTIVDVLSVSKVNEKYYYKVSYKNKLIGWFSPNSHSVEYFRTKKQEVKLLQDEAINNELNEVLKIDTDELRENWIKIFISDFYAVFNEKIYCGILLKDKLLGFVELSKVSFFVSYRNEFNFTGKSVNLYKDSKLEKITVESFNHNDKLYKSLGGFESFDGIRVMIDGQRYWVDQKGTNINIDYTRIENLNDIVIDTLMHQLNDKIEKQNEFYSAHINKLKERNHELVQREKNIKQKLKKFKEIL